MHCWSLLEFCKPCSVKQKFRICFTLLFISVSPTPNSYFKLLLTLDCLDWLKYDKNRQLFFSLLNWLLNVSHKIIIINLEMWKQNVSSNKQHFNIIIFKYTTNSSLRLNFAFLKALYTYMPLLCFFFFFPTALLYSIYALEHKFYRTTLLLSCQLIIRIISLCCDAAQLRVLI